jgi:hypothetical protein
VSATAADAPLAMEAAAVAIEGGNAGEGGDLARERIELGQVTDQRSRVAQAISGIALCIAILLVALVFVRRTGPLTTVRSLGVGMVWLLLTLVFEFGLRPPGSTPEVGGSAGWPIGSRTEIFGHWCF